MDGRTPVTLAGAKYSDPGGAEKDFHAVWDARYANVLDHTALALLSKDGYGDLHVDRHDCTAEHLAWGGALLGAALAVVAPLPGVVLLATTAGGGVGALVGHFRRTIPKEDLEAIGALLESGQSGLVVVAINKLGTDIEPLLSNADETVLTRTIWGDLDAEMAKEFDEERLRLLGRQDAPAGVAFPSYGGYPNNNRPVQPLNGREIVSRG